MGRGIAALLPLFSLAVLQQGRPVERGGSPAPLASGVVRTLELSGDSATHVRHFRLDRGRAELAAKPAGLLRWLGGRDPSGEGLRLEIEATFFEERVLVVHRERLRHEELVLTWREVREGGGRTLVLSGSPAEGYAIVDSTLAGIERRSVDGRGELPLALLEAARRGQALPAELALFEPASGAFEPLRVIARAGERPTERVVELVRADGTLRTRARFEAGEWLEWCWQEGGLVARAIPEEDYERWIDEHRTRRTPAAETTEAAHVTRHARTGRCSSFASGLDG
jgi:hypothetical protein